MYLLLGIGISNIAVINKFKELNIDFIVACKEEECKQAGEYSFFPTQNPESDLQKSPGLR